MLHAGGVLRDAVLAKQTAQGVFEVMAPKVAGAANVLAHARLQPTAATKLFSSIASAMGSGGQANYAAANATLDSWAHACQSQVGPLQAAWSCIRGCQDADGGCLMAASMCGLAGTLQRSSAA